MRVISRMRIHNTDRYWYFCLDQFQKFKKKWNRLSRGTFCLGNFLTRSIQKFRKGKKLFEQCFRYETGYSVTDSNKKVKKKEKNIIFYQLPIPVSATHSLVVSYDSFRPFRGHFSVHSTWNYQLMASKALNQKTLDQPASSPIPVGTVGAVGAAKATSS